MNCTIKSILACMLMVLNSAAMAMEKPATPVETYIYTRMPFETEDGELIIKAVDSKGKQVGTIYYKPHGNHEDCDGTIKCKEYPECWEITLFEVNKDCRKKKIGTELFKQCVIAVREHGGKTLIWDVQSAFGEVTIPVYDIIHIYQHITQKLGLKVQIIDEPETEQALNTLWATMMVPLEPN